MERSQAAFTDRAGRALAALTKQSRDLAVLSCHGESILKQLPLNLADASCKRHICFFKVVSEGVMHICT